MFYRVGLSLLFRLNVRDGDRRAKTIDAGVSRVFRRHCSPKLNTEIKPCSKRQSSTTWRKNYP